MQYRSNKLLNLKSMNKNDYQGFVSKPDFVAVDIEYADSIQSICQFGLTVVRGLEVVETRTWNIQPPGNRYEQRYAYTHHMAASDTVDAPTFEQAWPEIWEYLKDETLWAHNAASTENPVINKNIARCDKDFETIAWINDSRSLFHRPDCEPNKGNTLQLCCMAMGIPFDEQAYHNAGYDAEKCAELVIAYSKGVRPDWSGVPVDKEGLRKTGQQKVVLHIGEFQAYTDRVEKVKAKLKDSLNHVEKPSQELSLFGEFDANSEKPSEPVITPEEEQMLYHTDLFAEIASTCADTEPQTVDVFDSGDTMPKDGRDSLDYSRLDTSADNPLYDAKVCITGQFHISRKSIKAALEAMGAKETSSVAKTTTVILIGERCVGLPKLAAMEKLLHNGFNIPRIVGNKDLDRFLYGEARLFGVGESGKPQKRLNFTMKHFIDNHVVPDSIHGSEFYFPPTGFMGRMDCFCQMCGNFGSFGNWEYCPEVNYVILPNSSIEALKRGEKDAVIRGFEDYYNSQRSVTFAAKFMTEDDILKRVLRWITQCPDDDVNIELYTKYLESAGIDPLKDPVYGMETARDSHEKES